jgi:hypothetical protein
MKVLLVTPTLSGETITSVHVAENLVSKGHRVAFVASPHARRLIPRRFLEDVFESTAAVEDNLRIWYQVLDTFAPDAVVFADYPIVVSPKLSSPLGPHREWLTDLQRRQVCLVTFDHFGFGQCEEELTIGPRHLYSQQITFPVVPDEMRIMLPCPMHHPGPLEGRRGDPFRYWILPLGLPEGLRREVRRNYLNNEDDLLIMHSVPVWAWKMAEALRLPYYHFLSEVFSYYLEGVGKPVTLVSVNNGRLLPQPSDGSFRVVNLEPMAITEFEKLLFSADLFVTENKASIAMGKAICAFQPSVVLNNHFPLVELSDRMPRRLRECVHAMERERPGAVFPFEIFPVDMTGELNKLCLYRDNALVAAFEELEVFGGEETKERFARLLSGRDTGNALCVRQQVYVGMLQHADDATDLLERYLRE